MSQSRLETRPSIDAGTWRCLAVAQTIVPAVSSTLNTKQASISCHTAGGEPVAGDRDRRERPARRTST